MKNSPFSIHNLNPTLVEDVEKAFQRNVEAGRVVSDEFSGDLAKEGLADILKQKAAEDKEKATVYSPALDVIKNPDIREQFANAFALETALFERIRLPVPDAQMFAENGGDFAGLSEVYEGMNDANLEPTVVIAPYDISIRVWSDLYAQLAEDPSTIIDRKHGNGLYIHDGITDFWHTINRLPSHYNIPKTTYAPASDNLPYARWAIRIVPGRNKSDLLDEKHYVRDAFHTTIAEYLTLQASRIQANIPPVDDETATWLNGTVVKGHSDFATYGSWNENLTEVSLYMCRNDYCRDEIGSRLPEY